MFRTIDYFYIGATSILTCVILINSFSIFRLSRMLNSYNLTNLSEFEKLHPMFKKLYMRAIVDGLFPIYFEKVNKYISSNNLDKWFEKNEDKVNKLIDTYKQVLLSDKFNTLEISELQNIFNDSLDINKKIEEQKNDKVFTLNTHVLSKLFNMNMDQLESDLRTKFL